MQVRDVDPTVDERLKAAAAARGLSYSEFLRRELSRMADLLHIEDRWRAATTAYAERITVERETDRKPFEPLKVTSEEIVRLIREDRDKR